MNLHFPGSVQAQVKGGESQLASDMRRASGVWPGMDQQLTDHQVDRRIVQLSAKKFKRN